MICLGKTERLKKPKTQPQKRAETKIRRTAKATQQFAWVWGIFINYLLWHLCVNYRTKQHLQHICNYSI